ncbi:molybdopterin-dependent oxidoreductase [Xanthobacter dioxanivorans]|uniref:Molybdopterin-dependent oxidoreductase n=1 Tax=Xanthobacter dioxanivorans TaxID=2528964 RepID=A0A974SKW0_9HYPH|nr:molybdopterin-dependent oxidoreductase [Xanthobacter dioxanivorans]QRG09250.1 molybdopterin-dependent oxidoreductase [Xanthobacter dioxanivorans]
MEAAAREEVRTICSHCSTRCGVVVTVEGNVPVAIRGDRDHPVTQGFICPRGRAAIEYFHNRRRLDHPLKRMGDRGEGHWVRVPWDEAVDEIADRLKRIAEESGPEALAYFFGTYHGTDQGAGLRFMNLFGSPNYVGNAFICAGPKTGAEWVTLGFGPASPDLASGEARCIIVWAQHPSASNVPLWTRILKAKAAGAKLVVIDPVQTPEARAADLWLKIRPGTDTALALGLIHIAITEGWTDQAFIAKWTVGYDALAERVADYTPERVAQLTGLAEADIRTCAAWYADDGPAAISIGVINGMGRDTFSCERAKLCLIAVTGNINRPGGNILAGPTRRVMTKADLEMNDRLSDVQKDKRIGGDAFLMHTRGYEAINAAARRLWPQHHYPLTTSRGGIAHPPSMFRAIVDREPYPVRAAIVQHNNLVGSYANSRLARDALVSPNLELSVVHELFMTPTAALADFVMPAASWIEKSFMYVSGEGGMFFAGRRPVRPHAERHSDYEFFRDLGQRLGQGAFWPDTLEQLWDMMLAPAGLTHGALASAGQNWVNDAAGYAPFATDPATGEPFGFGTPSGKIELSSSILAACGADPLPSYQGYAPADRGAGGELPLTLMTGATKIDMTHTDHRQVETIRRKHYDPLARIHPDTASAYGIADGDWIWIESPMGRIRQRAQLSPDMPEKTVDAERWWFPERDGRVDTLFGTMETNVNVLVDDNPDLCDRSYGTWPLRLIRCRIEKADAPA